MDGEFSAEDERERGVTEKATKIAYQTTIILLIIALASMFWLGIFVNQLELLKIVPVVVIATGIVGGFLAYLISWVYFDNKI